MFVFHTKTYIPERRDIRNVTTEKNHAHVHFSYCHISQITAEPNEMKIAMTIKLINV